VAAAEGDLPAARHHLRQASIGAEQQGDAVGEAMVLHSLARMGAVEEVIDRLSELATTVGGELVRARAAHAKALADGDGADLEAVSGRFAEMGADLLAAEAAADSVVAWRLAGEARRAAAASVQLGVLTQRCRDAQTPALQAASARVHLTRAERDTALLAAFGRTNKSIAAELHRSVRTVEAQLYSAYAKLGVKGRSELAAALSEVHPSDLAKTDTRR
jgi:DNA-binding CsgD family transcriptional regulator